MKSRPKIAARLFLLAGMIVLIFFSAMTSSAEPVKVGFCTSLSGVYGGIGKDMKDGLSLYMDEIGSKAGGRDIKVIVKNIQSNVVSLAVDTATQLIEKDKIDILAGVVDTGCAYRVAKIASEHGVPFVVSCAGADDLTQRQTTPEIVRVSYSNSGGSHPLGLWAYEQGFRKAVIVGAGNDAGYEHLGGICRTFTKMGGQVVQELWTKLGTQDFNPLLAQINPDADVAFVFFAGGDAHRFIQQYGKSGIKKKLPVVAKAFLVDQSVLAKQGEGADGIISVSHWSHVNNNPDNAQFKTAFSNKYGRPPTVYAELGYVTGMVIAEGLKKTNGQVKGRDFVAVMRSLELNAPRGTIRFDRYGSPIQNYDIRKVQLVDNNWQNAIIKTYPSVGQFWTWTPEEFLPMPRYSDMKGKWAPNQ